jgi:NAD+ synthase
MVNTAAAIAQAQKEIIETLGVKPVINPAEEIRTRVDFLKTYVRNANAKGLVLGISGGQDSSLAGRLSQIAMEELRAEGYDAKFLALRLPYGVQKDEDDAQLALGFIQPDESFEFNIKETVDAFEHTFNTIPGLPALRDYDKGNAKARVRMLTQYAYASERGMLVVSTDHSCEALVGYFTKFGDGGADLCPLDGLTKGQGKQLLKTLNSPARLYEKAPTADLLDNKPGQKDEDELGVTYQNIDAFLEGKEIAAEDAEFLINRYFVTEHKRRVPYIPSDII